MRTVLCCARDLAGLAAEVTRTGRSVRLCVRGSSMAPAIMAGEKIWVAPVDTSTLAPRDIVMVGGPRPVVHRVVRIDRQRNVLTTRGDALALEDEPTDLGSVIGQVVRIDRRRLLRTKRLLLSCWRVLALLAVG